MSGMNAGYNPHLSTGFFPHDIFVEMRDYARMTKSRNELAEQMLTRIQQKADQHGLTMRGISMAATGKPDVLRDLERRGAIPAAPRLEAIAEYLGTTSHWLMTGEDVPLGAPVARIEHISDHRVDYRGHKLAKDVPVRGTAEGATLQFSQNGHVLDVESFEVDGSEAVDWLKRPPSLVGRDSVYGLYIVGWSMHPRYDDGDPLFVDPRHRVSIGDDVIVQLATPREDGGRAIRVLCKTLVRRTAEFVELEQYTPRETFRIPHKQIAEIHRVVPRREIYGI